MFNVNLNYQKIEEVSVLLDHMYFQIVKIDRLYKVVRSKTRFVVLFEILDICVEPDRFPEIKLVTHRLECIKYLVCARLGTLVTDDGIP